MSVLRHVQFHVTFGFRFLHHYHLARCRYQLTGSLCRNLSSTGIRHVVVRYLRYVEYRNVILKHDTSYLVSDVGHLLVFAGSFGLYELDVVDEQNVRLDRLDKVLYVRRVGR